MDDSQDQRTLIRFMLVSVGAALSTIALKLTAAKITGSVGLLSDAIESGVNLVAAVVALWALRLAARPPDAVHQFGHGKAEYISAAVEGGMIFVASIAIVATAVQRLINPRPLEAAGLGLAVSTVASAINLAVGVALLRGGRRHRSITLVADGKHLLTDVVTSAGVLVGVALVAIFDLEVLDPIVAILVGINILFTGARLVRRSISGVLDAALPAGEVAAIEHLLDSYRGEGLDFHALRTRESGRQRFVYVDLLVPDDWTVKHGHDTAERFKDDLADVLPGVVTFVHVEPRDDPASYGHGRLHPPVPPLVPPDE